MHLEQAGTNSQCNVHILQILGTGDGWHVLGPGSNVKNDWLLHPWNQEMCAFATDCGQNTTKPVEHNGPVATLHVEKGRVDGTPNDGNPCT